MAVAIKDIEKTARDIEREKKAEELEQGLAGFYGTDQYHRVNWMFGDKVLMTDGCRYLAEQAGAYWLMEVIGSYIPRLVRKREGFAVAELTVRKRPEAGFHLHNGNDKPNQRTYARQVIEYTDCPLDHIKLFVRYGGGHWVIMLTSEY